MNKQFRLGIVDSGAGGLSILTELLQRPLKLDLVYLADSEKYPYGALPESSLTERLVPLVEKLSIEQALDACIIACNTASTVALPALRNKIAIPFIGVVPAVKPASQLTKSGAIGILATEATVHRFYLKELIREFSSGVRVSSYGSPLLVQTAERYIRTGELNRESVYQEMESLVSQNKDIDTVVLACTHFPLLRKIMEPWAASKKITLLDSSAAIVNRVESLFPQCFMPTVTGTRISCRIISTSNGPGLDYATYIEDRHREKAFKTEPVISASKMKF